MKKLFVLILSLVLVMALAACGGGQTAGSAQQSSSAVQSGAATSGTDTPAGTETPSAPGSDVPAPADPKPEMTETVVPFPEEAKGAADLLPKLPDVKWEAYTEDFAERTRYTLGADVTRDVLAAYADAVKAAGYTNDPREYPNGSDQYDVYSYSGANADGSVRVMVAAYSSSGDKVYMNIQTVAEKYAPVPGGTWGNGMADHLLPQLPAGEWRVQPREYPYGMEITAQVYGMAKDTMVNYAAELKQMGYTNAAEENPDGYGERGLYKYTAKSADGKAEVTVDVTKMPYDEKILTTVKVIFFN